MRVLLLTISQEDLKTETRKEARRQIGFTNPFTWVKPSSDVVVYRHG